MEIQGTDCFHVHTYRCGHAENVDDEEYVQAAIKAGATGIWFTDHAPFPGDTFRNRMRYSQLKDYLSKLKVLKKKYNGKIAVHIGLEIEYFPSYDRQGYYHMLSQNPDIEMLLLGQHMAETEDGYTFSWDRDRLAKEEYIALGNAEIQGIKSGYFQAVAHPDRIFRRQKAWTEDMQEIADQIIRTAKEADVYLEKNESSKRHKHHYWEDFWKRASGAKTINGLDAHSIGEIKILE